VRVLASRAESNDENRCAQKENALIVEQHSRAACLPCGKKQWPKPETVWAVFSGPIFLNRRKRWWAMPASEVMPLFRARKLHSGKSGKIVRNKKQAKAILLSYLRKEGRIGPRKSKVAKKASRKRITEKAQTHIK
jgi:hypothetical protein